MECLNDFARDIVRKFNVKGSISSLYRFGNGHINDTFFVELAENGETQTKRYLLQRINSNVFPRTNVLLSNVELLTEKLNTLNRKGLAKFCLPTLINSHDNCLHYQDCDGEFWRLFHFIDKSVSLDVVETPQEALNIALAFGAFARDVDSLGIKGLEAVILDFHHAPMRFEKLESAFKAATLEAKKCQEAEEGGADDRDHPRLMAARLAECNTELTFCRTRAQEMSRIVDALAEGAIPVRIAHNDAKASNVLLDEEVRYIYRYRYRCVILSVSSYSLFKKSVLF
jgi:N-acetylhexosamine 1-kinase